MEAIGTIIVLAALAALVVSIWGLIKPAAWMRALRITSRKHAALLLAGAFVAFIVGGAMLPNPDEDGGQADDAVAAQEASPTTTPTRTPTPRPTATPIPRDEAQVLGVVDGDTIKVLLGGREFTVRYIGIDTPETVDPNTPRECFGEEASARNRELVGGKTVQLEKDVSETDRYGRLLRYVYVGQSMVNEWLVRDGYAVASSYPPDVKYQHRFRAAEQEARSANRGLWASCGGADTPLPTPTPPPPPPPPPPALSGGSGGTGGSAGGGAYYRNCTEARAAGAAPLYRGQPGYRPELDGDKDGVACE